MRGGKQGFTLLDLTLALVILALAGTVAVPSILHAAARARLNAAAGAVVDALDHAASLAARHRRPFGVALDARANTFEVYDVRWRGDAAAHPSNTPPLVAYGVVLDPHSRAPFAVNFNTHGAYRPAVLRLVPVAGGVVYYPQGHCGESDAVIAVRLGSDYRRITVSGPTGRVQVSDL